MAVIERLDGFSNDRVIAGGVLMGVLLLYYIGLAIGMWRSRDTPRISARKPHLVMISNVLEMICVFFLTLHLAIYDGSRLPCYVQRATTLVTVVSLASLYALRATVLLFQYEIEQKLASFSQAQANTRDLKLLLDGPGGWYIRHRRFLRPRSLITVMSAAMVLWVAVAVVLTAADQDCKSNASVLSISILMLAHIPLFAFLTARIWKFDRDALWIKEEFMYTIGIAVIAVIIAIITGSFVPDPMYVFPLECIAPTLLITASNAWPLLKSSRQLHLEFSKDLNIRTLADLLALPEGFASFLAYVKKEFASENVLFWREATRFHDKYVHDLVDYKQCSADCKHIHDTYISDNAPFQVNISYDVRTRITAILAGLKVIDPPVSPRVLAEMKNPGGTPRGGGGFFSQQQAASRVASQFSSSTSQSHIPMAEHSVGGERHNVHTPSVSRHMSTENVTNPNDGRGHESAGKAGGAELGYSNSATNSPAHEDRNMGSFSANAQAQASGSPPRQSNERLPATTSPADDAFAPLPIIVTSPERSPASVVLSLSSSGGPPPAASSGAGVALSPSSGTEKLGAVSSASRLSVSIPVTIPETDVAPASPAHPVLAEGDLGGGKPVKRNPSTTKENSEERKSGRKSMNRHSKKRSEDKEQPKKERNESLIPAHDLAKAFDEAITAVLQLMQDDTLSRYLQSDQFKTFQAWLKESQEPPEKGSKGSKGSKNSKDKDAKKDGGTGSKGDKVENKKDSEHSTSEKSSSTRANSGKTHRHVTVEIVA